MPSRRQVLAASCLALAGGAGCSRIRDAVDTGSDTNGTTTSDESATSARTSTTGGDRFRVVVTDGDREVELFIGDDVATVGEVEPARTGDGYRMPVTLTDEGTGTVVDGLERVGALEDPESHRIRTYFEGELLYEAKLGRGLADAMKDGDWDGSFLFHVSDRETAEDVKDALETA